MTINNYEHVVAQMRDMVGHFRFDNRWDGQFEQWHRRWRSKLIELMGVWPARCDAQCRWEHMEDRDAYTLHRVWYAVEPGMDTFALVGIPRNISGPVPGVLCIHGHGTLGALPVMDWRDDEQVPDQVARYHYDYGHRLARRGYVVWAPNLRGFGRQLSERELQVHGRRDTCDVNFFQQMLLGQVAITSQLHDMKVAMDLMGMLDQVDASRIGCAGLSYGGRMTMYLTAIEPRIRAAIVSGALNSFVERVSSYASCGYQVVPGLLQYGDIGDVLGLAAPRPLIIELGSEDGCCPVEQGLQEFERISRIYAASGSSEHLHLCRFDGGHIFHGGESLDLLAGYLGS